MATYSGYIAEVRRLLHDAAGNFWSDTELTDYINGARHRVVRDTGCLRAILTGNTTTSVETFQITSLTLPTYAEQILDVLNVNLYWGNTRIPLRYMSWTQFNAELRFWQNYVGRPIAYSMYGPNGFYISPVPDQNYAMEVDTVVRPVDLVALNDIETDVPQPWQNPIPFYAAYMAKFKEQSYGEAELFKNQYQMQMQNVLNQTYTRRMPDPYSRPY